MRVNPANDDSTVRSWILGIVGVIIVGWLGWVTKTLVDLDKRVAIIDYRLFGTVATETPQKKPFFESNMNLFDFLERKN